MHKIFILSDATGDLGKQMAEAAINQFPNQKVEIVKISKVKSPEEISGHLEKAKELQGVILFTFVSHTLREFILDKARETGILVIDVIGPTLQVFSDYFQELPTAEPGLQYKLNRRYFQRTEAVEFTVKHDDGLGIQDIQKADIVILGISRTSKTPLSIYLAYQGFRCLNLPLVHNIPVPDIIYQLDPKKMVGLTISPHKLAQIRTERLRKLGREADDNYAKIELIREEIQHANALYKNLKIMVLDVTGKAIEELASDIMNGRS